MISVNFNPLTFVTLEKVFIPWGSPPLFSLKKGQENGWLCSRVRLVNMLLGGMGSTGHLLVAARPSHLLFSPFLPIPHLLPYVALPPLSAHWFQGISARAVSDRQVPRDITFSSLLSVKAGSARQLLSLTSEVLLLVSAGSCLGLDRAQHSHVRACVARV